MRRSSRTPRRRAESPKSPAGQSRNASCERQSRKKRRTTVFEVESQAKRSSKEIPDRSPSPAPVEVQKIVNKVVDGRNVDAFCWICHKLGDELVCSSCPRVYHKDCLIKKKVTSFDSNFCECRWKTVDGSTHSIEWHPPELAQLLKYAMKEAVKADKKNSRSQKAENDKIHKFFKPWPVIEENKILLNIIDIDVLIDKIHQTPPYQNTGHFFLDVKWIYHNCCILFNDDHEMTDTALKLEKKIKQELLDIEACRSCYENKHASEAIYANFFPRVCDPPHVIVWAKIRGSPFWPAKCLKIQNGHADVRFFGTHDKSNVSVNQIYHISKAHPEGKESNRMPARLKEAMEELSQYIIGFECKLRRPFEFYEKRTPVSEAHPRSRSPKKRNNKKGKQNMDHAENPRTEENVSELKKPKIQLTRINEHLETKIEASLHPSCDSVESFSRRPSQNISECAEAVSSVPPLSYQLTFTTDDDADPSDTLPTITQKNLKKEIFASINEASHSSSVKELKKEIFSSNEVPHYSASENYSQAEIFPSLNGTPPAYAEAHSKLLPSASKMVKIKQDIFTNVNASAPFPVITSAESTVEEGNTLPISASLDGYPSTSETFDTSSAFVSKQTGAPEDQSPAEDCESDDEIQVLKETHNNPLGEYIAKNAPLSKTLCELLLANKPVLREGFQMVQTATQEFLLKMWLEVNAKKLDSNELKQFQMIYVKFLKRIESLKEQNTQLMVEVAALKSKNTSQESQIKSLLDKKHQKEALRDQIIKASVSKLNCNEMEKLDVENSKKIKELEGKIKELSEKNKELEESNTELKERHKDFEESYNGLEEKYKGLGGKYEGLEERYKQLEERHEAVEAQNKELETNVDKRQKSLKTEIDKNSVLSKQVSYYVKVVKQQYDCIFQYRQEKALWEENMQKIMEQQFYHEVNASLSNKECPFNVNNVQGFANASDTELNDSRTQPSFIDPNQQAVPGCAHPVFAVSQPAVDLNASFTSNTPSNSETSNVSSQPGTIPSQSELVCGSSTPENGSSSKSSDSSKSSSHSSKSSSHSSKSSSHSSKSSSHSSKSSSGNPSRQKNSIGGSSKRKK